MANAAAKKAAAAKKEATSIYFPVLIALNIIHVLFLYSLSSQSLTKKRIALTVIEWIGTYVAYQGILNDAEIGKLSKSGKKDKEIAGGVYLDLLGLIVFVQFGSIFIGNFINWLLLIVPVVYGLFQRFGKKNDDGDSDAQETVQDEGLKKELEERRKRRAERRRQKRA
jgi:bacteriorhodopsin